jgi:hydrogenase maturation protease
MNARHVLCFGNELHGDDGFGIHVYEQLCRRTWPEDVRLFNAGIAGLNALPFLRDCRQAILVDALANFGTVGEVSVVRPHELAGLCPPLAGHGLGLPYILQALQVLRDPLPDVLIVGAEIAGIRPFSPGLTAATAAAVPKTVRLIQNLLAS